MSAASSPCTGVCRIDPATGWCQGCRRTLDEIAAWRAMSEADRRTVMDWLAARKGSD
ncbi:DUF1289 domain-containing protein [Novosphingobium mangrovi (ex Huang et al. 2023)]|uniref:DUF1289 domain-containing protein n=1 Tax=Novosphingobium mangrovi (ex Huang et al. 2023) TaxID=2976432 RepID=A0ABT2I9R3_9SPHN|nr:DUF1289 domain-containing protein [Novosphingobium mangrovi (ex Huang et al. 2023)]MCT2401570.1 DUF1289 domain-containing protein [Novosphingobium mangrovi (ex Huang et al. 2023)]